MMVASMAESCKYLSGLSTFLFPKNNICCALNQLKNSHAQIRRHFASNTKGKGSLTAAEYCMDLVKKYDYENFLCTLLLPTEIRAAAFAIRAFNIEIAQIQDVVSNPDIGKMRIQFWKDSLEKIYDKNPPHQPVAREMTRILNRQALSKRWFKNLISSREKMLTNTLFDDLPAVEDYAENSVSSVYYLILESAGIKNIHADHCASHLGKAQGIINLLRGIHFNAKNRRTYLPQDVLIKHQVSQEDIFRGRREQKLKDLVFDIACSANQHLKTSRSFKKNIPSTAYCIFLPSIAIDGYLQKLEKVDFDVFHPTLQIRNSSLAFSLWWQRFRGNY